MSEQAPRPSTRSSTGRPAVLNLATTREAIQLRDNMIEQLKLQVRFLRQERAKTSEALRATAWSLLTFQALLEEFLSIAPVRPQAQSDSLGLSGTEQHSGNLAWTSYIQMRVNFLQETITQVMGESFVPEPPTPMLADEEELPGIEELEAKHQAMLLQAQRAITE